MPSTVCRSVGTTKRCSATTTNAVRHAGVSKGFDIVSGSRNSAAQAAAGARTYHAERQHLRRARERSAAVATEGCAEEVGSFRAVCAESRSSSLRGRGHVRRYAAARTGRCFNDRLSRLDSQQPSRHERPDERWHRGAVQHIQHVQHTQSDGPGCDANRRERCGWRRLSAYGWCHRGAKQRRRKRRLGAADSGRWCTVDVQRWQLRLRSCRLASQRRSERQRFRPGDVRHCFQLHADTHRPCR